MKKLYFLCFLLLFYGFFPNSGNAGEYSFISEKTSISLIIDSKDASSENAKDGYIHMKIKGGEAPYSVSVFSTVINHQTFNGAEVKLKDLGPGTYMFVIQDQSRTIVKEIVELSVRK
jgi:hypothetical protein